MYEYNNPFGSSRVVVTLTPDCPVALSQFDVSIARITPSWSPDNSLSAGEIAVLRARSTGEVIDPDAIVRGWTHPDIPPAKPSVEVEWLTSTSHTDPGVVCLSVKRIDIAQRLSISIYIAAKYRPSTCPYEALLRHEMKHANGFTEATDAFLDAVKKALLESPAIPSKARPLRVSASAVGHEQERIAKSFMISSGLSSIDSLRSSRNSEHQ